MSKNTTWKHIGIMRSWKIVCFICFVICLLGTLSNLLFYFSPEALTEVLPIYSGYTNFISAYALYGAFLSVIATVVMFCCYHYTKGKLNEYEANGKKTSPDVISELINFGKRYNSLLAKIDAASSLQELEALRDDVNNYNDDAEAFAEANGVAPKVITYSDYDSKKSKFE